MMQLVWGTETELRSAKSRENNACSSDPRFFRPTIQAALLDSQPLSLTPIDPTTTRLKTTCFHPEQLYSSLSAQALLISQHEAGSVSTPPASCAHLDCAELLVKFELLD